MTDLQKKKLIDELMYTTLIIDFVDKSIESITEDNITAESMKLKQSICDETSLKFGGCIASEFSVEIFNTENRTFDAEKLTNKWITVRLIQTAPSGEYLYPSNTLYPGAAYPGEVVADNEFYIFSGYIDSVKKDKTDNNVFNLIAYDALAKLYSKDATAFLFKKLTTAGSERSIENIFFAVFKKSNNKTIDIPYNSGGNTYLNEVLSNSEKVGTTQIINHSWINSNDKITFGEILKNICEMLGLFGFIQPSNGVGTFMFIDPFSKSTSETYTFYENFTVTEDFNHYYNEIIYGNCSVNKTSDNKVMNFKPEFIDSDISNVDYDISKNILAQEAFNVTHTMSYLFNGNSGKRITGWGIERGYYPITANVDGRLWVKIGDRINIIKNKTDVNGDYIYKTDKNGEYELDENGDLIIETETYTSYVLSRTLSGIQALTDEIETKG